MLVLNPIVVESNIGTGSEGDDFAFSCPRLTEFKANDQLSRLLPGHDLSYKIKERDLEKTLEIGDLLFTVKGEITILTYGVGPSITDIEVDKIVSKVCKEKDEDGTFLCDEMREIPGSENTYDILKEKSNITACSWVEFRELVKLKLTGKGNN